jgi:hypothetical protein
MSGKIKNFLGKSFEKSFPQQILGLFRGKSLFAEKNVRKIGRADLGVELDQLFGVCCGHVVLESI